MLINTTVKLPPKPWWTHSEQDATDMQSSNAYASRRDGSPEQSKGAAGLLADVRSSINEALGKCLDPSFGVAMV